MKLKDAINRLNYFLTTRHAPVSDEDFDAIRLGREALYRLEEYRQWHRSTADGPLPGETEE
jgi:hypothetical protein